MFYLLWVFYLLQRLSEMVLARKNITLMSGQLLTPIDQIEKRTMLMLHSAWFIVIIGEYILRGEFHLTPTTLIFLSILFLCQVVRLISMRQLKQMWVPFPVAFKNQEIIQNGIYRWIRHPNYLVVILEILIIPLLAQCYISAFIFSIFNLIFILKRINLEEIALSQNKSYQEYQQVTKKLVPFIY